MAKKSKRLNIGSIYKGLDGKPDVIKISTDVYLKKGQYVNLENEKLELEGIDKAVTAGALEGDYAEELKTKTRARWDSTIEKIGKKVKDVVRFNLVTKVEDTSK